MKKYIIIAALITGAFFLGKHSSEPEIKVEERIVERVVEVEVEKESKVIERVILVEERKDGSKTTRIEEVESSKKEKSGSSVLESNTDSKVNVSPSKTKHKIGIKAYFNRDLDPYYGMEYGRRLFHSNLWLKAEFINSRLPQAGLGISFEF